MIKEICFQGKYVTEVRFTKERFHKMLQRFPLSRFMYDYE